MRLPSAGCAIGAVLAVAVISGVLATVLLAALVALAVIVIQEL